MSAISTLSSPPKLTSDSRLTESAFNGFSHSKDVWYSDGSIVLHAGKTAFKVHMSVLAQNSEVFRNMCALAKPSKDADAESGSDNEAHCYDDCPVLVLQDSSSDLKHFLKALYRLTYFLPNAKSSFEKVSAVLRLSTKYIVPELRKLAVDLLMTVYPSTLAAWDQRTSHRLIPPFKGEYISYLLLAIQADIPLPIPAILYHMTTYPQDEVVPELQRVVENHGWAIISTYFLGVEKVREAEDLHLLNFFDPLSVELDCEDAGECKDQLSNAAATDVRECSAARRALIEKASSKSTVTKLAHSFELCSKCAKTVENAICASREKLWEELPGLFDMSNWESLRNKESFLSSD